MSRTDPETIGQSLDTAVIKCTVRDEPERTFDSGGASACNGSIATGATQRQI
jgi:hypothetical protein